MAGVPDEFSGEIGRLTLPMNLPIFFHRPVLLPEVIEGLRVEKGKKYVDATSGGGGYTSEIVKRGGLVLGIDLDRNATDYAKQRLGINRQIFIEQGNFKDITEIAARIGWFEADGIIFDLGMSSYQIEKSGRGFSFTRDEPLDMRMDTRRMVTAAEILNSYRKDELYEIFSKFAEELHSRSIAEFIVRTRSLKGEILRTVDLVEIITNVLNREYKGNKGKFEKAKRDCLARIFQALRIVVNDELNNLNQGLQKSINLLGKKGRLVVLSYHSLEDRIVKRILKEKEREYKMKILTRKAVRANPEEYISNTRSRSAKLRISEKI